MPFDRAYIEKWSDPCPMTGCWLWRGQLDKDGYGQFRRFPKDKWNKAHRVSFRLFKREPADGKDVAHTCHCRCCVNPVHLVEATRAENMQMTLRKEGGVVAQVKLALALNPRRYSKKGDSIFACAAAKGVSRRLLSLAVRGKL